jgi:hypothetical protein
VGSLPHSSLSSQDDDVGPRSELQYWRFRAQKFSVIIDQLQQTDFKKVIGVLREAKNSHDDANSCMRKWRNLDNEVRGHLSHPACPLRCCGRGLCR